MRFSKPCKAHLAEAKFLEGLTQDEFDVFCADRVELSATPDELEAFKVRVASALTFSRKKWLTVYVESVDLFDFLANANLKDTDAAAVAKAARTLATDEAYQNGLMVHLPKTRTSVSVCFEYGGINLQAGNVAGWTRFEYLEKGGVKPFLTETTAECARAWHVVFNLLMYMDAFPECVTEGCPQLHSKANRPADYVKSLRISASEAIKETYRNGMSPHMRRGHFRLLTSDKFTKKRGQTVYVKPTMVVGAAKTVKAP